MRLGNLTLNVISDGTFKMDAGALFGVVPKTIWERKVKTDRRNRVQMGLNCLLIRSNNYNILVDTGVGKKEPDKIKDIYGLSTGKLLRGLKDLGLGPRDINIVLLSHLHFDHVGGCTRFNGKGQVVCTFPKAKYMVQRADWEEATNPNERNTAAYHKDDFEPLLSSKQLELLDGDTEVERGVKAILTGGHSAGHQIVVTGTGRRKVAILGDLIATTHHLPLPYIPAFDLFPMDTLEKKRQLLKQAEEEGWLLIFSHDPQKVAGYLERRNGRVYLKDARV
ncbi:MAG: MBL fold metallo-hydrolase [Chloroflexi bacterium]|nr:MBL fold metallo-hydrolase [Chloroflexota bacterium]